MVDIDRDKELERLKKIDMQNKARAKRFIERQRGKGKRPFTAIVSDEAYNEIIRLKDAAQAAGEALTISAILERAIEAYGSIYPCKENNQACVICGKDIEQTNAKPVLYCSSACKQKAYRQRKSTEIQQSEVKDDDAGQQNN